MNGFNLSDIQDAKLGGTSLSAIYLGSNKLWPTTHDYSLDYFTIESLEDNNDIQLYRRSTDAPTITIQWSTDGTNWNNFTSSTSTTPITTLNTGDKMMIKGINTQYASADNGNASQLLKSTKTINVYGNIMSLLYGDNFVGQTTLTANYTFRALFWQGKIVDASNLILPATTLSQYCYAYMFDSCASLTTAPELPATTLKSNCYRNMFNGCTSLTVAPELPATTLTGSCYAYMFHSCKTLKTAPKLPATTLTDWCYAYMFESCASLTTAPELPATTLKSNCYMSMFASTKITTPPELPATTLAGSCYRNMFYGCASLTVAPELPATTLQSRCYQHMFWGCSSITTAPELPATTLADYCYGWMFQRCTKLNYIKCLATNISASNSHNYWLDGVASSGTFVKSSSMTSWSRGASGIPSGWTVQNI